MILYVMRHGPAEDSGPSGRDFDRRLTREGRAIVEGAALELRRMRGSEVPRILASPLVRAQQTAQIVQAHAGRAGADVEPRDELAEGRLPLELVRSVAAAELDVLLIGHQPTVEQLVRRLVTSATGKPRPGESLDALSRGFSTAMIVALEPAAGPANPWHLSAILDPRRTPGPAR